MICTVALEILLSKPEVSLLQGEKPQSEGGAGVGSGGQGRSNVTPNVFRLRAKAKHEEMLAVGLAAVRKQRWS